MMNLSDRYGIWKTENDVVSCAGISTKHPGKQYNEDAFFKTPMPIKDKELSNLKIQQQGYLFGVADGMGASGFGKKSSEIVAKNMKKFYTNQKLPKTYEGRTSYIENLLTDANNEMIKEARLYENELHNKDPTEVFTTSPQKIIPGSTIAGFYLYYPELEYDKQGNSNPLNLFAFASGDSSLYLIKNSTPQKILDLDRDSKGEITNYVGSKNFKLRKSSTEIRHRENLFMLIAATDGIADRIDNQDIVRLFQAGIYSVDKIAQNLYNLAFQRSSSMKKMDDATIIVTEIL